MRCSLCTAFLILALAAPSTQAKRSAGGQMSISIDSEGSADVQEEMEAQIEQLEKDNQVLKEVLNKTETQTCEDYCVRCGDGSTVWYGRAKNWYKVGASAAGGLLLPAGAVTAAYAAIAVGTATGITDDLLGPEEETHTSFTGYIPTTGWSCEKVDVYLMARNMQCRPAPLMQKSASVFGRSANNMLKPYNGDGDMYPGYTGEDITTYRDGCKAMKGAGLSGTFKQIWSNFQDECDDVITKSVGTCSHHSKLCGAAGVVGVTYDADMDNCQKRCTTEEPAMKCPFQQPVPFQY